MANIDITDQGGGSLSNGVLQLENGVAMDTTLRYVADQANTKSQLLLATNATTVEGTLKVKTDNIDYIDLEDGSGNNRFTISRPALGQKVTLDFASNPVGSTTIVGSIRTFTNGTNLNDIVQFREDGQTTFVERVNVEADSLVSTQSSSVIASTTTNANLVIAPNGTGALVASIPDGTATGGNARGTNAVDLQTSRTAATNVSSAQNSTISGGSTNTASSNFSTVSGGQSNTASTNTHATVVGGQSNTSSGQGSISGGRNCVASAGSAISFGFSNNVIGFDSGAFGAVNNVNTATSYAFGSAHTIGGVRSNGFGYGAITYLRGQFAICTGGYSGGDAQNSSLVSWREATLTTGATTTLSLDGTGTTNLIIPTGNNRMWNVQVRWVAVVTAITGTAAGVTVGDTKTSTDLLAVAKRAGTTTVSAHTSAGTHVIETIAGSLTAANIAYSAGASQEMAITFTGPTFAGGGSVTMRVVAAISLTEVAY
jgi:hypothetical protein